MEFFLRHKPFDGCKPSRLEESFFSASSKVRMFSVVSFQEASLFLFSLLSLLARKNRFFFLRILFYSIINFFERFSYIVRQIFGNLKDVCSDVF